MDCGIPFCHEGCPLGNLIPDWNDLVYRGRWREAIDQLHATNNFPEFTGLICPAPCESACVLDINDDPVTIEQIELGDRRARLRARAGSCPSRPSERTGRTVAVVGSGPGRAGRRRRAQQARPRGHRLRARRGPRRPDALRRARRQAREVGHRPPRAPARGRGRRTSSTTSTSAATSPPSELRARHDAVVIATGSRVHRDLDVAGPRARRRALRDGLPLPAQPLGGQAEGRPYAAEPEQPICAAGKRVVVIGGGDTGMDCISNAMREGAARRDDPRRLPRAAGRAAATTGTPWPLPPKRTLTHLRARRGRRAPVGHAGHRARGRRTAASCACTRRSVTGTSSRDLEAVPGSEFVEDGRPGAHRHRVLAARARGRCWPSSRSTLDRRGNVKAGTYATSVEGVFACGDARIGQSLIV